MGMIKKVGREVMDMILSISSLKKYTKPIINKSPKACESGRFSAEYDNLEFTPDTKSCTKILWDFVCCIARNGDFMNLSPG
jgi:hypothetical protein